MKRNKYINMSNIINNNFHNLRIKLNYDEYWDFFLNKDNFNSFNFDSSLMYDKCLISYIDSELNECVDNNWLYSTDSYKWEYSNVLSHEMYNIGYTALDNGLILFRRDLHNNRSFVDLYTKSKYKIEEGDDRLKLHAVSGGTNLYEYPITVENNLIKLNGGFYQGFFKTECDKYQVLPSNLESGDEWHFEFVLNKNEFEKESNKTLNDKYPNNKGIFFYIGTRAENKWVYLYNKDDECFSLGIDDYVEGGEIDKKDYKISSLIDANPDFIDYTEFAMDDYLEYKYYDNKLYEYDKIEEDDFFLDDYVMLDNEPKIIDEENNKGKVIGWCCFYNTTEYETIKKYSYGCGCRREIINEFPITVNQGKYLSGCDLFGDEYLSDIDDIEYGCDFIEKDLDIRDFDFETYEGISILKNQYYFNTDNKFLLFDRTCDGFNVKNWEEGTIGRYIGTNSSFKGNLFLLMNRTCTGYTVDTINELRDSYTKDYNVYNDIYDNALAFRITDDGKIGYRYLTYDCDAENQITIKEGYSKEGIIKESKWYVINVKITAHLNKMVLRFYVNGKLVFISSELSKLNLRQLKELKEKQETVPFNISLGGGTQGLCETILPNYMLEPYRVYPLEKYFAGTFIGYLKSFKFYNCTMEYMNINNNFKYEINKIWEV